MADSAPDPKVEDVLSSVRRLISQEIPKRNLPDAKPEDGALVLTSQDRIESGPGARRDTRSLEERIAELEAAVDSSMHDFEPDGSEDQAQHRPDRIVFTRPRPSEAEVGRRRSSLRLSEIALIETGSEPGDDGVGDEPVQFRRDGAGKAPEPTEAPMAEDVPTLPASTAEVRAFSDPDDVVARIEARIERGGDEELIEPKPTQALESPTSKELEFDVQLTEAVRASISGSAGLAGAESDPEKEDVGQSVVQVKEDAQSVAGGHELTDAPGPISDRAEDQASAPAGAPEDKPSQEPLVLTATDHAAAALAEVPDEDAMRLLVGRLMREELQGELGSKITRNVRKLVRSEVRRVLQSRELD